MPPPWRHLDRMHHPLSHTAGVVAGVAFIPVIGCVILLAVNREVLGSMWWWSVFAITTTVMTTSLVAYFNPYGRLVYLPVIVSGVCLLGILLWYAALLLHAGTEISPVKAWFHIIAFTMAWVTWAKRKIRQLKSRPTSPAHPGGFPLGRDIAPAKRAPDRPGDRKRRRRERKQRERSDRPR